MQWHEHEKEAKKKGGYLASILTAKENNYIRFNFPEIKDGNNPLITAISTFGIIGVGAAELLAYPYWCIEKGYGKYVGPKEGGNEWVKRAKGWINVMHWDSWGAMVVYTFCTIAFYLLGAAILGRTGLVPEGSEMIQTLYPFFTANCNA